MSLLGERENKRTSMSPTFLLPKIDTYLQTHQLSNFKSCYFKSGAPIGDDKSSLHCWGDNSTWSYDCTILINYINVNGITCHTL